MSVFPLWVFDRLRMGSDGKGITVLVCAHGCPLKCAYCLNPRSTLPESFAGNVTPEELYALVKKDGLYYAATGGGVTFGGGEPMLHAEFIHEFALMRPKSWNLCIETSLCVPREKIAVVAEDISMFFVDIKDMNPEIYRRYTGKDNAQVIDNLKFLLEKAGKDKVTVRVPRIPGYNTEEDVKRSLETLRKIGYDRFDCFTYITETFAG